MGISGWGQVKIIEIAVLNCTMFNKIQWLQCHQCATNGFQPQSCMLHAEISGGLE